MDMKAISPIEAMNTPNLEITIESSLPPLTVEQAAVADKIRNRLVGDICDTRLRVRGFPFPVDLEVLRRYLAPWFACPLRFRTENSAKGCDLIVWLDRREEG